MKANSCVALSKLPPGSRARLCAHGGRGPIPERFEDLGLVPGTPVRVIRRAPLGDPLEVELRGYRLCLRRSEADDLCARPEAPAG
jgi:Fe2+ transport system protein FeoA